jgi:hypothetical protein
MFTSKLIVQFLVQAIQLIHLLVSASSLNTDQLTELRIFLPITMNGAIQQVVWHAALFPATCAMPAIRSAIARNIFADSKPIIYMP